MLIKSLTRFIIFIATALLLSSASSFALSPVELTSARITRETQAAHRLRSWWGKEVVPAQVGIELQLPPQPIDYSDYARLLEIYVTTTGVKYDAWFNNKSDLKALDAVLAAMAKVDLADYSKEERVACYINLYNAAMLQAVLRNYPLESVKEIGLLPFSIFKKNFIQQGGRQLSLDDVEKGILLKDYFDSRIHFAVNCASESCPPLLAEPFVGKKLDAQLEAQTSAFAQSARAARVLAGKPRIAYSELFKWYKDDFEVGNPADYLNRYREMPLPLDHAISWIDYDWSLNSVQ